MHNATFEEQARQRTLDFFHTYCVENDMEKTLSLFSRHSSFIGWDTSETYLDYEAIVATTIERMVLPFFIQFDDISMDVIKATEHFCVVLFSAHITYRTDKGMPVHEFERATFVYRQEQGEPKIVYLHSSAAKKVHDLGKILPLEHGAEATRRLTQLECDRSMAIDMCEYTPNGLIYCLIGEHYPPVYANQTFCELYGCQDFAEFMAYTRGEIERAVYHEDWPRVQNVLLGHTQSTPYTITYRIVTKQGQLRWAVAQGQYLADGDTGEEYSIVTVIPLDLEQNDFTYGNMVDYSYIENAPFSVELFLQQTLDYIDFENRDASCQKLLQHCCETLQASGGVLYSIREQDKKFKIIHYFDKAHLPMSNIYNYLSWDTAAPFFQEAGFSLCSDVNNFPNSEFHCLGKEYLRSCISKVIPIQGEDAYLLTIYHRGKTHTWTENEQDIVFQAGKIFTLLLDKDF